MTTNTTILITGATDGVGRRVAERLAKPGLEILVHGRNRARGEETVAAIRNAGAAATFYQADLSSLAEVRGLAGAIARDHDRIDALISNAGIGSGRRGPGRELSHDGHELRFAVNYLAGFLLTRLLLPQVQRAKAGRIIMVASAGQQAIDFSDVMLTKDYSGTRAYCQSKLAQIMFTFDLAREFEGHAITANCLHPATHMATTMVLSEGIAPMNTVDQGADAILNLATSAELNGKSGLYLDGLRSARANAQAYDTDARARLRTLSFALTGMPEV